MVKSVAALAAIGCAAVLPLASAGMARADIVRQRQQWVIDALNVPAAWRITEGRGVLVAVIDSGVDPTVSDLTGSVTTGPDLTGVDTPMSNPNWGDHGTWMASLIAGHGNGHGDQNGIMGVAPQARILSIRVITDRTDPGYAKYQAEPPRRGQRELATAIKYAVRHGARVISMSLGYDAPSLAVRSAVQFAIAHNVVVVASSGNSGTTQTAHGEGNAPYSFPADYPGVIGVAAISQSGQPAYFSSDNLSVQVAAPGVNVPAQGRGSKFWIVSGTSPACALTAGVAALVRSKYPHLTPSQVMRAITRSTSNRPSGGYDDQVGFGTVDALGALHAAKRLAHQVPAGSTAAAKASDSGLFGGGEHGVPALPVAPRGKQKLYILFAIAAACLLLMIGSSWRFATGVASRRAARRASRAEAAAGLPGQGGSAQGWQAPGWQAQAQGWQAHGWQAQGGPGEGSGGPGTGEWPGAGGMPGSAGFAGPPGSPVGVLYSPGQFGQVAQDAPDQAGGGFTARNFNSPSGQAPQGNPWLPGGGQGQGYPGPISPAPGTPVPGMTAPETAAADTTMQRSPGQGFSWPDAGQSYPAPGFATPGSQAQQQSSAGVTQPFSGLAGQGIGQPIPGSGPAAGSGGQFGQPGQGYLPSATAGQSGSQTSPRGQQGPPARLDPLDRSVPLDQITSMNQAGAAGRPDSQGWPSPAGQRYPGSQGAPPEVSQGGTTQSGITQPFSARPSVSQDAAGAGDQDAWLWDRPAPEPGPAVTGEEARWSSAMPTQSPRGRHSAPRPQPADPFAKPGPPGPPGTPDPLAKRDLFNKPDPVSRPEPLGTPESFGTPEPSAGASSVPIPPDATSPDLLGGAGPLGTSGLLGKSRANGPGGLPRRVKPAASGETSQRQVWPATSQAGQSSEDGQTSQEGQSAQTGKSGDEGSGGRGASAPQPSGGGSIWSPANYRSGGTTQPRQVPPASQPGQSPEREPVDPLGQRPSTIWDNWRSQPPATVQRDSSAESAAEPAAEKPAVRAPVNLKRQQNGSGQPKGTSGRPDPGYHAG